jgi:hypothetical protein
VKVYRLELGLGAARLTDHQGSITAVANAAGNAIAINSYDP